MAAGNLRSLVILVVSSVLVFPMLGQAATKYKEVEVSDGGSVAGKVSFEGALPADAVDLISITKNPEVCDKDPDNPGYREVVWVDVEDGALRGVFVFIDKIKEGKKWSQPEGGNYVILQKGCRFRPWAQVVRRGPIIIRHSDGEGVLHNINFIPVAFAAWDGSNSESGSRHTLTTWYWLLLKPAAGNTPLLAAVAAFVLILLAEIWWARSASRKAGRARG